MKSWLKFFGLSFFSDKIAKEAKTRGILNCVLAFVLSLIFIFCGVLAANFIPFDTHLKNSSRFNEFAARAFDNCGLSLSEGKLVSAETVNTFTDEGQASRLKLNGYNLVVDTRPADAYDDFEAYCVTKDGKREIPYESYLELPEEERKNYNFRIRYTPDELIISDEMLAGFESYLSGTEDKDIKSEFQKLSSDKSDRKKYVDGVYSLYVKAYYPDLSVPKLRNYYFYNYVNRSEVSHYLILFEDLLVCSFETDGGVRQSFYGVYEGDGKLTADGAQSFLSRSFHSTLAISVNVYLINIFRLLPFIMIIPLLLALISMIILIIIKDDKYKKYSTCFKIQGAFIAAAALITAIIVFVCGFFVSVDVLNVLPLIVLSIVLLIRTVIFVTGVYLTNKKTKQIEEEEKEDV